MESVKLDERTSVLTYKQELEGRTFLRTVYQYKNPNGTVSVCSDVVDISAKPEIVVQPGDKRSMKKEKV
jgi:hypothetical protein